MELNTGNPRQDGMSSTFDWPQATHEDDLFGPLGRVAIPVAGGVDILSVNQIDWIESDGNYVHVYIDGSPRTIRATLRGFAARLDPRQFRQIHRSTVVNVSRIVGLRAGTNGDGAVVLVGGRTLRLSRRYRPLLLEILLSPLV